MFVRILIDYRTMKGKTYLKWSVGILLAVGIKWFSGRHELVEEWYSRGFYPPMARALRMGFGWLPFSLGDLLYLFLIVMMVRWVYRWGRAIFLRRLEPGWGWSISRRLLAFCLSVYILFYGVWGLNYSRLGIASIIEVDVSAYTTEELEEVVGQLVQKLNREAERVVVQDRDSIRKIGFIEKEVTEAYKRTAYLYPELSYGTPSIKKSLTGPLGNYLGFSGYLNPFTNEAQINATIPLFYQPAVACHEAAHQLGYSSEAEANFVGYLAGKSSPNPLFTYSIYFDMVFYGLGELQRRDSTLAASLREHLHPRVMADREEYRHFLRKHANMIEPIVEGFYDAYLRANDQAAGIRSYDEVIGLLMAYYRRYGSAAL